MRALLLLFTLLLAAPVRAQAGDDSLTLFIQVERAAWAAADETLNAVDGLFRLDTSEALAGQLRRVRQRGYAMGTEAARADLLLQLVAAMRRDRGEAIARCADEAELADYLDFLQVAGDDLVEMDPSRFTVAEPFDPADLAARLDAMTAPMRALVGRHMEEAEPVCAAGPTPHHPPGHAP